jgi:hypothetical protein
MFNRKKKPKLEMIDTSSRMALKMTCLNACRGDVRQAQELYAFLADGISDMPDYTPPKATLAQHAKSAFTFFKENRNEIAGAWNFIQQLRNGTATTVEIASEVAEDLPPLPN